MKKTLVAIAALAAATGAMAQSSVTLYGTVDAGYGSVSSQLQGVSGAGGDKVSQKGLSYNNYDSSRWGITTTEDLGGGQKAGVAIESWIGGLPRSNFGYGTNSAGLKTTATQSVNELFSASGAGGSVDATRLGDRLLYTNFISGAHEVRLGQQSSFTRDIVVPFQADGSNNIGNLAANDATLTARYVQAAYLYTGNGYGLGAALSNQVRSQTNVNEINTAKGYHLKATAGQGPWAAGVAYSNVLTNTPTAGSVTAGASSTTAQLNSPTISNLANPSASANTKVTAAVGSYDLVKVKLYAEYGKVSVSDADATSTYSGATSRHTQNIGARLPVINGDSFAFAQVSSGKLGYSTSGSEYIGKWSGYTVGVKYMMSKRTYAYVNGGKSSYDFSDTATLKASQYAAGLVHNF